MVIAAQPVASLPAHDLMLFLVQVGLLLGMATIFGRLATRFGLPAVVGELATGVLLGPSVLEVVAPDFSAWLLPHEPNQMHLLDAFGQVGVLLLVGLVGTGLELTVVRRRGTTALWVGLGGVVLPFGLGVGAGLIFPASLRMPGVDRTVFALFLGVALCVSAIPVIAKTLADLDLLHRDVGQLTVASAIVDDTIGWAMLAIVSAMATRSVGVSDVVRPLLMTLSLAAVAAAARMPLRRLLRVARRCGCPLLCVVPVVVLLVAAAAASLGLEPIFGAFLAGLLLGSCPEFAASEIQPLRTVVVMVLAPVFFASAGLRADLTKLAEPAVLGAGVALFLVAVIGKFAGVYLAARWRGIPSREAAALGAGLNARGVVEIVVATVGLRIGVLNAATFTIIILIAIATSLLAAFALRLIMRPVAETPEEELRSVALGTFRPLTPHHDELSVTPAASGEAGPPSLADG